MRIISYIVLPLAAAVMWVWPTTAVALDPSLTPLHRAAYINDTISLKSWLAKGENVDAQAKNGTTPLHIAAFEGKKESIQLLLDAGADANIKDKLGRTPLDLAFLQKHLAVAGLLIPLTINEDVQKVEEKEAGTPPVIQIFPEEAAQ